MPVYTGGVKETEGTLRLDTGARAATEAAENITAVTRSCWC